jgi:hypothetical protein
MFLVFKTTVDTHGKANELKPSLDELLAPAKWNFDLADHDNILRVEEIENISGVVINVLNTYGFECIELE